jgi:hypothetical protein
MGFKPRSVSMLCGFYRTLNPSPKTKFAKAENLRVKGRRPFSCCQIARGACLELGERGESRTLGTNGRYCRSDRSTLSQTDSYSSITIVVSVVGISCQLGHIVKERLRLANEKPHVR